MRFIVTLVLLMTRGLLSHLFYK